MALARATWPAAAGKAGGEWEMLDDDELQPLSKIGEQDLDAMESSERERFYWSCKALSIGGRLRPARQQRRRVRVLSWHLHFNDDAPSPWQQQLEDDNDDDDDGGGGGGSTATGGGAHDGRRGDSTTHGSAASDDDDNDDDGHTVGDGSRLLPLYTNSRQILRHHVALLPSASSSSSASASTSPVGLLYLHGGGGAVAHGAVLATTTATTHMKPGGERLGVENAPTSPLVVRSFWYRRSDLNRHSVTTGGF